MDRLYKLESRIILLERERGALIDGLRQIVRRLEGQTKPNPVFIRPAVFDFRSRIESELGIVPSRLNTDKWLPFVTDLICKPTDPTEPTSRTDDKPSSVIGKHAKPLQASHHAAKHLPLTDDELQRLVSSGQTISDYKPRQEEPPPHTDDDYHPGDYPGDIPPLVGWVTNE